MTITHNASQPRWTPLGQRMGFTSTRQQCDEILGAIQYMAWTLAPKRPLSLDGSAAEAIIAAAFRRHRFQIRFVGVAQLNGGRQLVGLQDARGGRDYVLDLESEAIHVLVELPHRPIAAQSQSHAA